MIRRSVCLLAFGALVSSVTGCDDHDDVVGDAGTVVGDAGTQRDANVPVDAGPPATTNAQGVLSAYPTINYSITAGYKIVSASFIVTAGSSTSYVDAYLEIQNTGATTKCNFLPDFYLDGQDLLGVLRASPYFYSGSTVTTDCLAPGEIGVLLGIGEDVTEADLATAVVSVDPNEYGSGYTPASGVPAIVAPSVVSGAGGFHLRGNLSVGTTIHNYGLHVFPRDSRGLLVNENTAYPNDLGSLYAGTTVPFETITGNPTSYTNYVTSASFISGAKALGHGPSDARTDAVAARVSALEARRASR